MKLRTLAAAVVLPLALSACAGYEKLCQDVFVDDAGQPGKWSDASRGSCTGGPVQTVIHAVKGAL